MKSQHTFYGICFACLGGLLLIALGVRGLEDIPPSSIAKVEAELRSYIDRVPEHEPPIDELGEDSFYLCLAAHVTKEKFGLPVEPIVSINKYPKDFTINIYFIRRDAAKFGADPL